jgi:hypothetical protein
MMQLRNTGYNRAPYIARQIIKPLIEKWRMVGAKCVVSYDDGMCVANCPEVVCTVRLLLDYLLDLPIDIHSRMVVLDLAGDIDFEKPKS